MKRRPPRDLHLRTHAHRAALLALLAAVLAACGQVGPALDELTADLTVRVRPADARVEVLGGPAAVLVEEHAFEPNAASRELRYRLRPGRYTVRVSAAGHAPQEAPVEVETAAPVALDVELEPGAGAPDEPVGDPVDPSEPAPAPSGKTDLSLRGDAGFDPDDLGPEARRWYDRLWYSIEHPDDEVDPARWAASDNLYTYARSLHTHLQNLLFAFRLTGDLRLLDEIDRLTEIMRSKLRDEWRGTLDGTDGTRDGYLNWVYRRDNVEKHVGKDLFKSNDLKTAAVLASYAYALELNRDLESPGGVDYGARADTWKDYLVDHFEAKWREREGVPRGFPIMLRPHTHTYVSWIKWHYYMHALTGEAGYLAEAERMADMVWENEIQEVSSPAGPAYVWARSILSEGGGENYLHPTVYAKYVLADSIEFHFEGFHRWQDERVLTKMARAFAEFVIDRGGARSGSDWFAPDIGGGVKRAGIPPADWKRFTVFAYEQSPYPSIMAWDDTGKMLAITEELYRDRLADPDRPDKPFVPAGMFLRQALLDRDVTMLAAR